MLTPDFIATQTDVAVELRIRAPYVRNAASLQLAVGDDGRAVTVLCEPYLLRVVLPASVCDADPDSACIHDPRAGTITVVLPKTNVGVPFPNLDFAATLLAPNVETPSWAPTGPSKHVQAIAKALERDATASIPLVDNNLGNSLKSRITMVDDDDVQSLTLWDTPNNINQTDSIDVGPTPPQSPPRIQEKASSTTIPTISPKKGLISVIEDPNDDIQNNTSHETDKPMKMDDDTPASIEEIPSLKDKSTHSKALLELETLEHGTAAQRHSMLNIVDPPQQKEKDLIQELTSASKYGFWNQYHGNATQVESILGEICDITPVGATTDHEKFIMLRVAEECKFDQSHYLYDFMTPEDHQQVLLFKPAFRENPNDIRDSQLSADDQKELISLPNSMQKKDYVSLVANIAPEGSTDEDICKLLSLMKQRALTTLVDIIFAACYNYRFTEGDPDTNVEAVWTIGKLSNVFSTVSMLPKGCGLRQTLINCYRRALCFPLFRTVTLCDEVRKDVAAVLSLGRRETLRRLLELHKIFKHDDRGYILDSLFIQDLLIYIQKNVSDSTLQKLGEKVLATNITKSELDFDLEELEKLPFMEDNDE